MVINTISSLEINPTMNQWVFKAGPNVFYFWTSILNCWVLGGPFCLCSKQRDECLLKADLLILHIAERQLTEAISQHNVWNVRRPGDAHLGGADDHAIPVSQCHVIVICKAPAYCTVSTSLLSFLQFLQQPKAAGNYNAFTQTGQSNYLNLIIQWRKSSQIWLSK